MKPMKKLLSLFLLACLLPGCAYLRSTTVTTVDPKTGIKTDKTTARAFTFLDGKGELSKFKNTSGGKTSGTTIGGLNQESNSTNAVNVIGAMVEGAVRGALIGAKP